MQNVALSKLSIINLLSNLSFSNHDEEDSLEDATEDDEEEDEEELSDELEDNWANSTATGDNWTDYDQDIYMHRNTRKFGHSTGGGMFSKDDVNL